MLCMANYYKSANQNYNEVLLHIRMAKFYKTVHAREGEREPPTLQENVKWYRQ